MLAAGLRSFQRGTVSLCRSNDCEIRDCQTLRKIQLSKTQTGAARKWFDSDHAADFFSNFQL